MEKPKVGDVLYSLNVGNDARHKEQKLTPVTVSKVGRKYFSCKRDDCHIEKQYHIENWREKTNYCVNSVLYRNKQDWFDERDRRKIVKRVKDVFIYRSIAAIPIDQMKIIEAIIDKYIEEPK